MKSAVTNPKKLLVSLPTMRLFEIAAHGRSVRELTNTMIEIQYTIHCEIWCDEESECSRSGEEHEA